MTPRPAWVAAVLLGALAWFASERVVREMPDLEVYWKTAVRARAAEPLYRAEDEHYQFKYLPAFAVLSAPIAALPLRAAKQIWFVASVLLIVALVTLSVSLPAHLHKPAWLLTVVTTAAMAKFYGHELILGQVNVLFALVVVAALHAIRRGREATAGALFAAAIVIKPYAVIFLPWLIARRRASSMGALAAGLALVLAIPAIVYGVSGASDLHGDWWRTVTESTAPNLLNADNVSIAAMYAKWFGPGQAATVLAGVTTIALLGAVFMAFSRPDPAPFPEGLEGSILLTCIPLISPQGWDYVFLVSTPAVVYLVNHEKELPGVWRAAALTSLAVVGLSVFDLMGRAAYARFMALSVISVCYLIIVFALCVLRSRRALLSR